MKTEIPTFLVDGSGWNHADDVYRCLLPVLDAPDWHGANLDALWDSLACEDINDLRAPFRIVIYGASNHPRDVHDLLQRIRSIFARVRSEVKLGVRLDVKHAPFSRER